jgi:hypothetical protein
MIIYNPLTGQVLNRFNARIDSDALEASKWQDAVREAVKKPKKTSFFSKFRKPAKSRSAFGEIGKMFKSDKKEVTSSWRDAFKI